MKTTNAPTPLKTPNYPTLQRYKCTLCGKLTAGKLVLTANGDSDCEHYPRRHYDANGAICKGTRIPAEKVRVPAALVKTRMN
ncbi:hypothetical protein EON83_29330 [bacterium]|nr:MAG: hypothetical protein EON83_29330 [bacterium]